MNIPRELHRRARVVAAQHGHSLSEIVRSAIEEYVEQMEDQEVGQRAQAAFEHWKADPTSARPWEEVAATSGSKRAKPSPP
jgi:predicted DNA-binding protein